MSKGDIIGYTGNTKSPSGEVFDPHLHWEALPPRWNIHNGTYGRVNPFLYCKEYWNGAPVVPSAPNQRKNGPYETMQRIKPVVDNLKPPTTAASDPTARNSAPPPRSSRTTSNAFPAFLTIPAYTHYLHESREPELVAA